jgi:flagellar M-ring protein FliF
MPVFDQARLKASATNFATGFTPGQKVVTGLLAAILVVAGIAYSQFAGRPQYAPLFTGLTAADASAMTTKLTADKVPYQLTDGGTAILVPQGDVNQERLNMAQASLPAGGTVGLELMDKEGITTSQAVQSADYQRALQGELEGTIGSISGVAGAQVTLALPAQSDFVIADETKPQASVLVTMATGQTLSNGQVTAIVHLVASSIPNLSPDDVTVVDNNGNVLAAPGVGITASGGTDAAQGYEESVAAKITAQLIPVVGVGHANVQVSADVDTSQKQTTSQLLITDPKGKVVSGTTSSSTTSETYTGANGATAAGVLGATTTGTTGTTGAATSTTTPSGGYVKKTTDNQYSLPTQQIVTTQGPGTVNRLSIAVLVDTKSKANIANITKLATAAAGLNLKRGDTLSVVQMPFSTTALTTATAATKAAAKAKSGAAMTGLIRLVVAILGILALIVLLLKSTKRERREDISVELERVTEGQLALPSGGYPTVALPSPRTAQAAGELAGLIEEAPDEVAKVLRSWMHERSGSGR